MADEDTTGAVGPAEFHQRLADALRRSIRTATPGVIHAYSRTGTHRNTADVELPVRPDGEELPVLARVPVLIPGGGDGYLVFPHERGDTGLVVCCDTEIGAWRASGDVGAPADEGRLGLSGAVLLPGLRPRDKTVDAPAGATVLAAGDLRLGDQTATKAAVHEELLADLDTFLAALDTWGALIAAATGVPWAGPQVPLLALRAGISGLAYQSPSVKVED